MNDGLTSLLLDPQHPSAVGMLLAGDAQGASANADEQLLTDFLAELESLSGDWLSDPLFAAAREEARRLLACLPVAELARAQADPQRQRQALMATIEAAAALEFLPKHIREYLLDQVYEPAATRDAPLRALREQARRLVPERASETDHAWTRIERQVDSKLAEGRYAEAVGDLVRETTVSGAGASQWDSFDPSLLAHIIDTAGRIADAAYADCDRDGEYAALMTWIAAISQAHPASDALLVDSALRYAKGLDPERGAAVLQRMCSYAALVIYFNGQDRFAEVRDCYRKLDAEPAVRGDPLLRAVLDKDVRELLPCLWLEAEMRRMLPPRHGDPEEFQHLIDTLLYEAILQEVWVCLDETDFEHAFDVPGPLDLDDLAGRLKDALVSRSEDTVEVGVQRFRVPNGGERALILCVPPASSRWEEGEVGIGLEMERGLGGRIRPRALSLWALGNRSGSLRSDRLRTLLDARDYKRVLTGLSHAQAFLVARMQEVLRPPKQQTPVANDFENVWAGRPERLRNKPRDQQSPEEGTGRTGAGWVDDED